MVKTVDLISKIVTLSTFILLSIFFVSCDKFEGEQTIPSYIHIDTIYLGNNPLLEEGVLTHNFTDVWVYVNDQLLGAFELPATIPVLVTGENTLTLYAGIKLNGMSGTRSPYIFVRPREYEKFNFIQDSILDRNPTVTFYDNAFFAWMENFEDPSLGLKATSNSDTTMTRITYVPSKPFLGSGSGAGYTDADHPVFEVTTYSEEIPGLDLPQDGGPVIMEMEYNTNVPLLVGLIISGSQLHGVLILNPTDDEWKKIYVNFTPAIDAFIGASFFNVFFHSEKQSSADVDYVFLDNLKLIHRDKNKN